jgi:hypothetical protein
MPLTSTLQEVVLVEHFAVPLNLTILDVANWVHAFGDYPVANQLALAAPIELQAPGPMPLPHLRFLEPNLLPRLLLKSASGERTVQMQADRFAIGWARTKPIGEPDNYPGYDTLRKDWVGLLARFNKWCRDRLGSAPDSRLVEVGYNNAAPLVVDGRRRRLSEIFQWVQPGRGVNAFQTAWTELLKPGEPGVAPDALNSARVSAVVALGSANGASSLIFNFTGFGPTTGSAENAYALEMMDNLHKRILDIYSAAIISEVQ